MKEQINSKIGESGWGPLSGLRVLDFTQSLSGPYCTQILADLGATVFKVEAVKQGDTTRYLGPFHASDKDRRHSGYFHSVNRNKKSIAVDLKTDGGRDLIFDIVQECDVVVENFRAGTMDRLGLSWEVLSARNERLIYAALRGFGDPRSGASPYMDWPAYDVVAQAMGGINAVTGPDEDHPTKIGPGVGDIVPGMFLAIGIVSAALNRESTGKGQFVDVAMVDSILALTERIVYQRSFGKMNPRPIGNHHPFTAPFGMFKARDGHVAIGAVGQDFFEVMCNALDATELFEDERFSEEAGRRRHREALIEELADITVRFTKAELMERLGGKVPFGPVYTADEIAADPHFAAREMLPELQLDGVSEPLSVAGVPIKMSRTPGGIHCPGSDHGADTNTLLQAIGYGAEKVDALKTQGAIK